MTGYNHDAFRPAMARRYEREGLVLTDEVWESICATVDKAPPMTEEMMRRITSLLVPVPASELAPAVDTPSTRPAPQQPQGNPRKRRAGRAA